MANKIHILPTTLANQIAAGEVIERPASVVKELLENAHDAGATKIDVIIKRSGLHQIKITDNGSGIGKLDLPLAFCAHATSKIRQVSDLFSIDSLGFRGEALASISAVSRCHIASKTEDSDCGYEISHEGNQTLTRVKPCAHPQGTTVIVNDLFYNTPVRREFLKSPRTELIVIEKVIKHFALSCPTVAFSFKIDDNVVLNLPAATSASDKKSRVGKILGNPFIDSSIEIETNHAGLYMHGWLSQPNYMRSQNDKQYFFVNGRMVRDKLINHAIKQAYDGLLYPGRHPAFALYLELAADEVDVNVHPTKHEVRFKQARLIHDFIQSQLHKALIQPQQAELVSEADEVEYQQLHATSKATTQSPDRINQPRYPYHSESLSSNRNWNQSLLHQPNSDTTDWINFDDRHALIAVAKQWLLCDISALMHQYYIQQLAKAEVTSRPILVPVKLALSSHQVSALSTVQATLKQRGLEFDFIDEDRIAIRNIPTVLAQLDFDLWLKQLDKHCHHWSEQQWIESLVNATPVELTFLDSSQKELIKTQLKQALSSAPYQRGMYKPFSSDDIKKVLHAKF